MPTPGWPASTCGAPARRRASWPSSPAADLDGIGALPVNRLFRDMIVPPNPLLAGERVHAQGTPVAAVVAESPAAAWDAVALIRADYEALPGVALPRPALAAGAPALFDVAPGNRALGQTWRAGDPEAAFAGAARVVELTVQQNLLAGVPMETRGAVAAWDAVAGELTAVDLDAGAVPHPLRGRAHARAGRGARARDRARRGRRLRRQGRSVSRGAPGGLAGAPAGPAGEVDRHAPGGPAHDAALAGGGVHRRARASTPTAACAACARASRRRWARTCRSRPRPIRATTPAACPAPTRSATSTSR